MSESKLFFILIIKLVSILFFVLCYVRGGRHDLWIRRYLGGGGLALLTILLSVAAGTFDPLMILGFGIFIFGLTRGYSSETGEMWEKVLERTIFGMFLGIGAFFIGMAGDQIGLGIIQFLLAVGSSVWFGTRNPLPAVYEEGIISLLSSCLIPFMV